MIHTFWAPKFKTILQTRFRVWNRHRIPKYRTPTRSSTFFKGNNTEQHILKYAISAGITRCSCWESKRTTKPSVLQSFESLLTMHSLVLSKFYPTSWHHKCQCRRWWFPVPWSIKTKMHNAQAATSKDKNLPPMKYLLPIFYYLVFACNFYPSSSAKVC